MQPPPHLIADGREEVDALRDEQRHPGGTNVAHRLQEHVPGAIVLALTPTVRPADDDRVRLHATEPNGLHAVVYVVVFLLHQVKDKKMPMIHRVL